MIPKWLWRLALIVCRIVQKGFRSMNLFNSISAKQTSLKSITDSSLIIANITRHISISIIQFTQLRIHQTIKCHSNYPNYLFIPLLVLCSTFILFFMFCVCMSIEIELLKIEHLTKMNLCQFIDNFNTTSDSNSSKSQ